jgi:hypothetical protein
MWRVHVTRDRHYGHALNITQVNQSDKKKKGETDNIIKNKRGEKSAGADTTRDVDDAHDVDTR